MFFYSCIQLNNNTNETRLPCITTFITTTTSLISSTTFIITLYNRWLPRVIQTRTAPPLSEHSVQHEKRGSVWEVGARKGRRRRRSRRRRTRRKLFMGWVADMYVNKEREQCVLSVTLELVALEIKHLLFI